jgi:hypothetical protein
VFAARYELNSYIVFRKRLVSKRLSILSEIKETCVEAFHISRINQHLGDKAVENQLLISPCNMPLSINS